jgi:hypothetical protein
MSQETEAALEAALFNHLRDTEVIKPDDMLSAWFICGVAVDNDCSCTHNFGLPQEGQPIHVTMGMIEYAKVMVAPRPWEQED